MFWCPVSATPTVLLSTHVLDQPPLSFFFVSNSAASTTPLFELVSNTSHPYRSSSCPILPPHHTPLRTRVQYQLPLLFYYLPNSCHPYRSATCPIPATTTFYFRLLTSSCRMCWGRGWPQFASKDALNNIPETAKQLQWIVWQSLTRVVTTNTTAATKQRRQQQQPKKLQQQNHSNPIWSYLVFSKFMWHVSMFIFVRCHLIVILYYCIVFRLTWKTVSYTHLTLPTTRMV